MIHQNGGYFWKGKLFLKQNACINPVILLGKVFFPLALTDGGCGEAVPETTASNSWDRLVFCPLLLNTPHLYGASLMAQWWRTCLPMQETWVQSLGREDPLEKETATHSSIPAWKIPWTEEPGRPQSVHGVTKESEITWRLNDNYIYMLFAQHASCSFIA